MIDLQSIVSIVFVVAGIFFMLVGSVGIVRFAGFFF